MRTTQSPLKIPLSKKRFTRSLRMYRHGLSTKSSLLLKCVCLALCIPNFVPESQALMATSQTMVYPKRVEPLRFLYKKQKPSQPQHRQSWPPRSSLSLTTLFSRNPTNKQDVERIRSESVNKNNTNRPFYEFIIPSIATGATYKLLPLAYETASPLDNVNVLPYSFLLSHYATRAWNAFEVGRFVKSIGPWYIEQLGARPMATKSLTAGIIGAVGDGMAQLFTSALMGSSSSTYQLRRGLAVFLDGLLSGPLMHIGYEMFERMLPTGPTGGDDASNNNNNPFAATLAAIAHVVADSVLLDTFFVGTTILFTGLLEGVPLPHLLGQFRSDYWATLRASWITSAVLFPIQFSCFRYLPLRVRVLAVNCIDVVWDAVLSFYAHRSRTGLVQP